jgi:hypothetical protein
MSDEKPKDDETKNTKTVTVTEDGEFSRDVCSPKKGYPKSNWSEGFSRASHHS